METRRPGLKHLEAIRVPHRVSPIIEAEAEAAEASRLNEPHGHMTLTPSSWRDYFDECEDVDLSEARGKFRVYSAGTSHVTFLFIHGAGCAALSWALVARLLKEHVRVVAVDLRGHGSTVCEDESDLSKNRLVEDIVLLCNSLRAEAAHQDSALVLVGHSLGGAIAAHVCGTGRVKVDGLVVLDVVEGEALQALPFMQDFLASRPRQFANMTCALAFLASGGGGYSKNPESVRIHGPALFCPQPDGTVVWRTDLVNTSSEWHGWFDGMNQSFLKSPIPKILVIASPERLDKEMTICHMQGKFQLEMAYHTSHHVHEDSPGLIADLLIRFQARYKFGQPFVIPYGPRPVVKPTI